MEIGRIEGATRVLGKSQGYRGLPLRDQTYNCSVSGPNTPEMVTAWYPTIQELLRLVAGAPVYLHVTGVAHPPVFLEVGNPPD